MIRTNLSTRPFYNERLVHLVLAAAAVVLVAATAVNVGLVVSLSSRQTALAAGAAADEARMEEFTREAAALRGQIDAEDLRAVVSAAHEANALIDRRMFSWTALFNHLETTLPPDVMLTSIRPDARDGTIWINMVVIGRSVEQIDAFMERLERTGAFADLLSRQEDLQEGGYRAVLRGRYLLQAAAADPGAAGPAREGEAGEAPAGEEPGGEDERAEAEGGGASDAPG